MRFSLDLRAIARYPTLEVASQRRVSVGVKNRQKARSKLLGHATDLEEG